MTGMVAMAVATLLQTALMARELGASGLGIVATVMAVTAFTSALVSFRTTEALTRWLVEPQFRKSSFAMAALISSAISAELIPRGIGLIAILTLAPTLANIIADGEASAILFMLHGITVIATVPQTVWLALMRQERRFSVIVGLDVLIAFLRLGCLYILSAVEGLTVMAAVNIFLFTALVKAFIQSLQIRNSLLQRTCGRLSFQLAWLARRRLAQFWSLMASGYLASVIISPFKYGDVLLLSFFSTNSEVGLYKVARTIVALLQSACNTFATVLFQDINEALRNKKLTQLVYLLKRITKQWILILITLIALSVSLAPLAAEILLTTEFSGAIPIFYILLAGSLPGLVFFWSIHLAIAADVYEKALPIFCFSQILNYAFAFWATLEYGAVGMATALGLHWTLSFVVFLLYSLPKLRLEKSNAVE